MLVQSARQGLAPFQLGARDSKVGLYAHRRLGSVASCASGGIEACGGHFCDASAAGGAAWRCEASHLSQVADEWPCPHMCGRAFFRLIEGSLEVKLLTIWTDEKQSREEAERRERLEERRARRKKMQMWEKVGKSRNTVFFQWFGAPEGRKVGSLKRRVRSQLARWEMKNCTPLWREAHFQVKMRKTPQLRSTFRSCDVEKVHAVVARSTCRSQNVQNTPFSDHSWKLRCRKSARRCGAKHISKSKCTKHTILGPLLEVEMSKKCTPLWREAHFEVKMYKTHHGRSTFGSWDVEKVHAVVARSTFGSQNVKTLGVRTTFGGSDVVSRGRRTRLWILSKVSKTLSEV